MQSNANEAVKETAPETVPAGDAADESEDDAEGTPAQPPVALYNSAFFLSLLRSLCAAVRNGPGGTPVALIIISP